MANYRPQLFLRTADINVSLQWPEGTPDANEKMVHIYYVHNSLMINTQTRSCPVTTLSLFVILCMMLQLKSALGKLPDTVFLTFALPSD